MLINVFRNQKPFSITMVFLVFTVLWVPGWWMHPADARVEGGAPLYILIQSLSGRSFILNRLLTALMIWFSGITLNGAVNRQDLFKVKNNFTLFFVVFLGSCIPETSVPSPALWSLPFIGLSLRELLCLYFEERSLLTVMNAGLFLSLGWLMYFPVITFLPLLIIAILLNGYTDWRHIAVIFVGSIALPLIVLPLWIWFPHLINTDLLSFWSALRLGQTDLLIPMAQLPVMIAVLVLSVTSIVELALNLGKKRVSNRKNFLLILWATLIALFGMLIAPVNQVKQLVVLALLPISLIMANFFYYLRNDFWSNALVIMLLIAALISVYIPQVI